MTGYMLKPQYHRHPDGGDLIVGPFQLNWYGKGIRLHITWPRMWTVGR